MYKTAVQQEDMHMRIIAVDDERIALEGLMSSIKKVVPEEEIHGFRSSNEALEFAKAQDVDIAFLDIDDA